MNLIKKLISKDSRQTPPQVVIKGKYNFYMEITGTDELVNNKEIKFTVYSDYSKKTKVSAQFKWYKQISNIYSLSPLIFIMLTF